MQNAVRSIVSGLRLTTSSSRLVLALWLTNVLAALPAAVLMSEILEGSIGPSLFHQTMSEGFDHDWYLEFSVERQSALARTFTPSIIGIGSVYDNLEAWWSGRILSASPVGLIALGIAFALLWTFLLGGILQSLSQAGRTPAPKKRGLTSFLTAGSRTFGRFLQLAIVAGVLYFWIYRLGMGLYRWIEASAGKGNLERAVLWRVLASSLLVIFLLHLVRMIFDYAKISVFHDDLKAPRALGRALVFVATHPVSALGAYAGPGLLGLLVIAVYSWIAPGANQSTFLTVLLAFLASQIYLILRLSLRLTQLASELSLVRMTAGLRFS